MLEPEANSYDDFPYHGHFFPSSHPDRMAAMATLFGLTPPDPGRCRVLELGCAEGANLLPMAQAYPRSSFLGIDLSTRQVRDGMEVVRSLGIDNLELRALSLADVGEDFGRFDYIVCHGVYSWVDDALRDKILEVSSANLNVGGVAYVSYNTYPGWHLRGMVRDMLLYHDRAEAAPAERVQQARAFLEFLKQAATPEGGTFAKALDAESALLADASESYFFHEHLEENNHPVYFHQFVAHASSHGLQYLGPARFSPRDSHFAPETRQVLDQIATDRVRREQYADFLRNRAFRQSLLCHSGIPLNPAPSAEALRTLRISALAKPESASPEIRSVAVESFRSATGDQLSTNQPAIKAALLALFEAWPRSLTFEELRAEVRSRTAEGPGADVAVVPDDLAELLRQCHMSNLVALHVREPAFVLEGGERPRANALARHQAGGAGGIVNARLLSVVLDDFDRVVLRLLDGTRDRPALVDSLAARIASGDFEIRRADGPVVDDATIRRLLAEAIGPSLDRLAHQALLQA